MQENFLNNLDGGELRALPYLFEFWAMPHQLPPEGPWRTWVILGGRGAGKTRAGAEWVRAQVEGARPFDVGRARRLALVGETVDQVRDVMIFGDSGILACTPEDRRPRWEAGRKRLIWPNGAEAQVHSAHNPEALRGPQFDAAWADEYGCAAIDKGANQPNKFLDQKSSESSLPAYSNGGRDDLMQMQYLRAMSSFWGETANNPISPIYSGPMVDMSRAFVWAWDARPYPFFPNNLGQWSDGTNYARGHWISGRTSARTLASVVQEICARGGVIDIDTSALHGFVRGYSVDTVASGRAALQPLMLRFGFDAVERDGVLKFMMRGANDDAEVSRDWLARVDDLDGLIEQDRDPELEMSGRMRVQFVQADGDYDALSEEAVLPQDATHSVATSDMPLAMTRGEGRQTAERWLAEARVGRDRVRFGLPPSRFGIGAGDVIRLPDAAGAGVTPYRVDRVEQGPMQIVEAIRVEASVYEPADVIDEPPALKPFVPPVPVTPLFLDLPLIRGDEVPHAPHIAATAAPWPGRVAVYQAPLDNNYALNSMVDARAIAGITQTPMLRAAHGVWDHGADLQVQLTAGNLESTDPAAVLAGANLAAIGDGTPGNWELFQFTQAELIGPGTYALRGRLRGQLGSDGLMPNVWPAGSWFVLLDGGPQQIDLSANLRQVTQHFRVGPAKRGYDDTSYVHLEQSFDGNGLRPYAPSHLKADRDGAGNLSLSWIRRSRIEGDQWDGEVPLGEEAEHYRVQILQGGDIIREADSAVPAWVYPAALQAQDGVSGTALIVVAQVSARYGPGLAASVTLDI